MGIKFDKDPLAAEQNDYTTKILNAYIVYDFDGWPRNPINDFKFKNCLFGTTNIVKNSDKEKWLYSGYGRILDGAGSWNFGNDYAWNFLSFGVDNSRSPYTDHFKNNISKKKF